MNAYFQVLSYNGGTGVRLVPATDGGDPINVLELMNYLDLRKIEVMNTTELYTAVTNAAQQELVAQLNMKPLLPQAESFSLTIAEDKMSATVRFYPPSIGAQKINSPIEIVNDLRYQKVLFGVDMGAIQDFIMERKYCTDYVIAHGKEPRQGKDAEIVYFFDTDQKAKPTRNEDGSVDFFNLNTIRHVHVGDELAKLIPEDLGDPGTNVCGEKIKPYDVKRAKLRYGRNIKLSEDGLTISSTVNGHVTLTDGQVFVSDVYQVEDVGTATGNIESEGSVLVTGNVIAGFSVKAKGNVEVRGVVEGADIEAEGNIIIAKGMNGMNKGNLKAGGNVILKFIENATVTAGGYVESESIMHSHVNAGTEVKVDGHKGFIAGGVVRATERVSCKVLGSAMGTDTSVEVGASPELKARFQELQKEIMDINKTLQSIQPVLMSATQKLQAGEKFPPDQLKYIQSLAAANQQKTEELQKDQIELLELDDILQSNSNACIRVADEAFPGARVAIGDTSMVLKENLKFCRFVRKQGEVTVAAY